MSLAWEWLLFSEGLRFHHVSSGFMVWSLTSLTQGSFGRWSRVHTPYISLLCTSVAWKCEWRANMLSTCQSYQELSFSDAIPANRRLKLCQGNFFPATTSAWAWQQTVQDFRHILHGSIVTKQTVVKNHMWGKASRPKGAWRRVLYWHWVWWVRSRKMP